MKSNRLAFAGTAASIVFGILLLSGCGSDDRPYRPAAVPETTTPTTSTTPTSNPTTSEPTTPVAPAQPKSTSVAGMPGGVTLMGDDMGAARKTEPQEEKKAEPKEEKKVEPKVEKKVEKKADVGVGKKGRGYGKGVIVTPVATLFAVRERLVFTVQIPEAMKLFKATEGRAPKDNDEFMTRIIKEQNIHLPTLPEGDRYMYDPKTEELMVESPAPE